MNENLYPNIYYYPPVLSLEVACLTIKSCIFDSVNTQERSVINVLKKVHYTMQETIFYKCKSENTGCTIISQPLSLVLKQNCFIYSIGGSINHIAINQPSGTINSNNNFIGEDTKAKYDILFINNGQVFCNNFSSHNKISIQGTYKHIYVNSTDNILAFGKKNMSFFQIFFLCREIEARNNYVYIKKSNLDVKKIVNENSIIFIENSILKTIVNQTNCSLIDCSFTDIVPIMKFERFIDCQNSSLREEINIIKNQRSILAGTRLMTNIVLMESYFEDIHVGGDGGAASFRFITTKIEVDYCTFCRCSAGRNGGAIFANMPKNIFIKSSCYQHLSATNGVAIFVNGTNFFENFTQCSFVKCSEEKINSNKNVLSSANGNQTSVKKINVSYSHGYGISFLKMTDQKVTGKFVTIFQSTAKLSVLSIDRFEGEKFQIVNNSVFKGAANECFLMYANFNYKNDNKTLYSSVIIKTNLTAINEKAITNRTILIDCIFDCFVTLKYAIVINETITSSYQMKYLEPVECFNVPTSVSTGLIVGCVLASVLLIFITVLLIMLFKYAKSKREVDRHLVSTLIINDFG